MKTIISIFLFFALISCKQQTNEISKLQERIKVLEAQVANSYKPGFGELMSSVQAHHAKLWFAGIHKNWKLAEFEVHEITEVLDDVKKYQNEREESKFIDMMLPALDSITSAIKNKEVTSFKNSYIFLTNTCNNCHLETKFEYNIVKIPEIQQYSNQDFSLKP
jgi:molecular chaperone GrpE (heat shock protein)